MTIGLQITDGTTTIDLNDGSYFEVTAFDPGFSTISALETSGSIRLFINGTKAQIQTELAALQKLLQQAMEYSGTGEGGALYSSLDAAVYLYYRTDSGEAYYRSPIVITSPGIDPADFKILNFDCGGIEYVIDFTRKNWWEGAEAQVPLATALVTATTNAVTVYNPAVSRVANTIAFVSGTKTITDSGNGLANFATGTTLKVYNSIANDGTYTIATGGVAGSIVTVQALNDEAAGASTVGLVGITANYVDIAAVDVGGDMPSATRLEITNTYNNANGISRVWIGQNFKNPAGFVHILEAESAVDYAGVPIVDVPGFDSGGAYASLVVGSGAETDLLDWTISTTDLSYAAGRWYKALVRFNIAANVTSIKYRLQLEYNGAAIWRGPLVAPDSGDALLIHDILTFQLPPAMGGLTSLSALHLVLRGYQTSGVNLTILVDFLQLTPVDGYRELRGSCEYNRRIIDDGITPILYEDNGSGTAKTGNWVGYSSPILLQPGRAQRLYFLNHTELYGTAPINQTMAIKVYYRPRRYTI